MSNQKGNKKSFTQQKKRSFIKKVTDAYKSTTLWEKLASFGAILLISVAVFFNTKNNPLLVAVALVTMFALFNLFVYKTRILLTSIVIALHITALPYVASIYSGLIDTYIGDVLGPLVVISMFTFILSVIAYRTCRGRYWVTLIILYLAIDIMAPLVSILFSLYWGTWMALIMGTIALIIRTINWRALFSRKKAIISTRLINGSQKDRTKALLEATGNKPFELNGYNPIEAVRIIKDQAELITTLTPKKPIIFNDNRFYYDGEFIEPLLFDIAEKASDWSRKNKISRDNITVVVLIHDVDKFPSSDLWLAVKVSEKGSNNNVGNLLFTTPEGLKDYHKFYGQKPIPEKTLKRIQKAVDGKTETKGTVVDLTGNKETKPAIVEAEKS